MDLPRMVTIRQELKRQRLPDPAAELDRQLDVAGIEGWAGAGRMVAVAVGSRTIDRLPEVVSQLVKRLEEMRCDVFIVPAMGSHGGASAEGQARVLDGLGVSEKSTGAPIESSMETVSLGTTTGGVEVFVDRAASRADGVVVVNRVAPHTGYWGPVQSGAVKMIAVGLGNSAGAASLHRGGFGEGRLIGEMADLALRKMTALAAVALVEDGARALSRLEVLKGDEIRRREPALLEMAISMWPRIPVDSADILVVDEMGKDFSGTGMDPLVTGRGKELPPGEGPRFSARRLVALGLSEASGGNATGVGHADVITERLFRRIDFPITHKNVITSGALFRARIPIVAGSDREAVTTAMESLGGLAAGDARVVRIKNTRHLEELQVSSAVARELEGVAGIEIGDDEAEMSFDEAGG
jgi:Lactate racemase N-terminal domain